MSPRIHFAILTYNALELTRRCFASIAAHTQLPYAVTVLDNASRDGTQAYLRSLADPRFTVLESAVNLGVPGGRNVLLDAVLPVLPEDGFVVFLDNDIELQAGWCDPFLRLFEREPRAGLASADGWVIQVRGDTRVPLLRPSRTARVDICAGGFACWARKAAARDVGRFDEALGLFWHEDDDWSVRMAQAGWQVFVVPEAKMVHRAHASGVGTSLQDPRSLRNQGYLAAKWRAHGQVDESGFIVAQDAPFYVAPERRAEIAARLDRRTPICRGEWAQAVWDHEELARCVQDGTPFRRPASPLLSALLGDESGAGARAALALLRHHGAGTEAGLRHPRGLSRACRASDYDDALWLDEHRALFGPTAGPDWFRRNRHEWAATRIAMGLRALGVLRPGATGLDLAMHGTALPSALREGLRTRGVDMHSEPAPCDFAFALAGPLVSGSEPRFRSVLDAAARWLRHDGVLALAVDVALEEGAAPVPEAIRAALRAHGFEPCGATDLVAGLGLPGEPLAGLADGPWPALVSGRGPEAHTSAVLFARKGVLPALSPAQRAEAAWHCTVDLGGLGSTTALTPWQRYATLLLRAIVAALPRVRFTLAFRRDPPPALWPVLRHGNVTGAIAGNEPGPCDLAFLLCPGPQQGVTHERRCALSTSNDPPGEGALYLQPGSGSEDAVGLGVPAAAPCEPPAFILDALGVDGPYAAVLFGADDLARVVPVLQAFATADERAHLVLLGEAAPLLREPVRTLACGNRVHSLGVLDPGTEAAVLRGAAAGICLQQRDPRMATLARAGVPVLAPASSFARSVLGAAFRPWAAAALHELLRTPAARSPVATPEWADVAAQVVAAWRQSWPELFAASLAPARAGTH